MPTHQVAITLPAQAVLHADVKFSVYADGALLGTLAVSQGGIDWRARGRRKPRPLTWEELAALMEGR